MNHEQEQQEPNTSQPDILNVESEPTTPSPRIYVASLSDYNNGRLHGVWIDATLDDDEINQAVTEMLSKSSEPYAEEYAVHSYEGFGPLHLHEYEPLASCARIARGIKERGPAFAHFASVREPEEVDLDAFDESYVGHYESLEAYAEELLNETGLYQSLEKAVPDWLAYVKVDVEQFAYDLELSGDVTTSESGDGGVFIYRAI
jgi:antirestriction protein